ncbi:MAG: hypothetical protein QM817_27355 [Archangium sp.]
MGTYHTFFVATDQDLDRLFPGWQRVKPERGKQDWEPVAKIRRLEDPNLYVDAWGPPLAPVLAPEGEWADYARMIEQAGAPGLRALPHFRSKNVEAFYEFEALNQLLLNNSERLPPARLGDQADDDVPMVTRLPAAAARKLVTLAELDLRRVTKQLLEKTDLSEEGDLSDEGVSGFIEGVMNPLRTLCREAEVRRAEVCHYCALHY